MRTTKNDAIRHGLAALLYLFLAGGAQGAVLEPELEAELDARAPNEEVTVIIKLADKVDPRQYKVRDRKQRNAEHVKALKHKAALTQAPFRRFLEGRGGKRVRELWAINGIAVKVRANAIRELAARPGIEKISLDAILQAPAVTYGATASPEWNLAVVQAPDLWALGYTGTGVVVASMDTGVDANHPDLVNKWRGGSNSWFDPHGEHATPYDMNGHGTQTMGIIVGGSAGGTAIGMAPDATWTAVKLFNDAGQATYSDIHLAFQWLLDPDGDPNTMDAPDVVNASWGLVGTAGQCIPEFNLDIENLKAAAIAVVFAGGNDGPAPLTSVSPANNLAGFSTGAVDSANTIAIFSSRGQSACDGGIYPKTVAPGVNISTSDLSFGGMPLYAVVSGTSYAAPHTAGAMALLADAFPNASVAELEAALIQGALDLGVAGPDNGYGNGIIHARAAYDQMLANNTAPSFTSLPVTAAVADSLYTYTVQATDPAGSTMSYSLTVAPAGMTINTATGMIRWTPTAAQSGANAVTVRVTNARGLMAEQSFTVVVLGAVNHAPVAVDDRYVAIAHVAVSMSAPGVLINDTDQDGNALNTTNRTISRPGVTAQANGSFTITRFGVGTVTALNAPRKLFTYRVQDNGPGLLTSSNAATVMLDVINNRRPVAVADAFTVPRCTVRQGTTMVCLVAGAGAYVPQVLNLPGNDYDLDATETINGASQYPLAVSRIRAGTFGNGTTFRTIITSKGARVTISPGTPGSVTYTPLYNFSGTDSFQYRVKENNNGVDSDWATVTVTVQP